jgi:hypothetical protein
MKSTSFEASLTKQAQNTQRRKEKASILLFFAVDGFKSRRWLAAVFESDKKRTKKGEEKKHSTATAANRNKVNLRPAAGQSILNDAKNPMKDGIVLSFDSKGKKRLKAKR